MGAPLLIGVAVVTKLMRPRGKPFLSRMLNEICPNGPKDKNHRPIKAVVAVEAEGVAIAVVEEVEIGVVIRDKTVEDNMTQAPNMDRRTQIYKVGNIIIQVCHVVVIAVDSNAAHSTAEIYIHVFLRIQFIRELTCRI